MRETSNLLNFCYHKRQKGVHTLSAPPKVSLETGDSMSMNLAPTDSSRTSVHESILPQASTRPIAENFAEQLAVTRPDARLTLHRVIDELGITFVERTVNKSREIHNRGAMRTLDNSRPRTLGGIFFWLVRNHLRQKIKHGRTSWQARAHRLSDVFPEFQNSSQSRGEPSQQSPQHT